MFHVMITALIILTVPTLLVIILNNKIPNWALVITGVITAIIAMYPAINYIWYVVCKKDLFKDMF
jgi:hypothetical protein